MRPPPFEHVVARSVEEAVDSLREHGDDAKVLAGGQSLVPLLALRLARPSVLVDVTRVESLGGIALDADGWLRIGATTRQRAAERSALVADRCPLLAAALPHVAHAPIRTQGTIGGSLCHADPAAELPLVALALGAELVTDRRTVPAGEFFRGFLETALAPDELLLAVRFPPATGPVAFAEYARREGDFAVAAVAVAGGAVWATGAGPVARRLPDDLGALDLADDLHGTGSWRRRVLERLRGEAVAACA